jgi:hypothetical protein
MNRLFAYGIMLGIFIPLTSAGQPYVDVASVQHQHFLPVDYKNSDGKLHAQEQQVNLLFPLEQKNQDVILLGGEFKRLALRRPDRGHSTTFYAPLLQFGYLKHWSEQWQTTLMALPKLSSDLQQLNLHQAQMGGAVLMTYHWKEDIKLKFGLYYNREFFGNFFMPLGGIDWQITDRLQAFGVLPGAMNVEYRWKDPLYIGLRYRDITTSYRRAAHSEQYIREGHTFWGHNQLGAFIDWYFWEKGVLSLEAGHTAWREYTLYNAQDQRGSGPLFQEFQNGPYLKAKLSFRVWTRER